MRDSERARVNKVRAEISRIYSIGVQRTNHHKLHSRSTVQPSCCPIAQSERTLQRSGQPNQQQQRLRQQEHDQQRQQRCGKPWLLSLPLMYRAIFLEQNESVTNGESGGVREHSPPMEERPKGPVIRDGA